MEQIPVQDPPSGDREAGKRRSRKAVVAVIAVVTVLAIAFGAYAFWHNKENVPDSAPGISGNNSGEASGETATSSPVVQTDTHIGQNGLFECSSQLPVLASTSGAVQWQAPRLEADMHLFASTSPDSYFGQDANYLVGHFISGKYEGGDLYVTIISYNVPSPASWHRIVRKGDSYVMLGKYSDPLPSADYLVRPSVALTEDGNFDLPDLNLPARLETQSPPADFILAPSSGFFRNGNEFFCGDKYVKVFTDPVVGDVYTEAASSSIDQYGYPRGSRNGFYVRNPDGRQSVYQLNVELAGENRIPLVTWNDGNKNASEYSYQAIGGCGATNFRDIAEISESALLVSGRDLNGRDVYEYKDSHAPELQAMYDQLYVLENEQKISYAAFAAGHAIFFWKDPFGKFIRFTSRDYQPLAECGKPVIYLYPQTTRRVEVRLSPHGGFSYTEPEYENGWNVMATPAGALTNLSDGKTYPYLFWEGRGGIYETPEKGFVIDRSSVHSFLLEKLRLLGLNEKESADFIEYWEPKMQSSPYYFVTFMGNDVMDSLAPLDITPVPDTVIRVLMDFRPLPAPIAVEGYSIRTPRRDGFTVVEWGGVLR